jgi:hypothetical protein
MIVNEAATGRKHHLYGALPRLTSCLAVFEFSGFFSTLSLLKKVHTAVWFVLLAVLEACPCWLALDWPMWLGVGYTTFSPYYVVCLQLCFDLAHR